MRQEDICCANEDNHGCLPCPICGKEYHTYTDEPYCDVCGRPFGDYFTSINEVIGKKKRRNL